MLDLIPKIIKSALIGVEKSDGTIDLAIPAPFSEQVLYNGRLISALAEIGTTKGQGVGIMRNARSNVVQGDGFFTLRLADVPSPQRGDAIRYRDKIYNVAGVEVLDTQGGCVVVRVTVDEKGWYGRQ